MPSYSAPPTIRKLAQMCHLSKSTVAMALHNDRRIAAKTRNLVREVAREAGYQADSRVSHLMSLLRRQQREAIWNVAWVNSSEREDTWTDIPWFSGYLKGALRYAKELGYAVDQIWLNGRNPKRIVKILKARGIQGLLIPFPAKTRFWTTFPWAEFSAVAVDEADTRLSLSRVMSDRYGSMRMLLDHLAKAGYRVPALWLQREVDQTSDEIYSSAFLGWHYKHRLTEPLVWLYDQPSHVNLRKQIRAHRPDVIICSHNLTVKCVQAAGFSVPKQIAVVHLNLAADVHDWSGIDLGHESIGTTAMEVLNALLIAGKTGTSLNAPLISIPGMWRKGTTSR